MENNFQFLIYRSAEEDVSVNAIVKDESIWLTQKGMAELFGVQSAAINKHLANIYEEGELQTEATISKKAPEWSAGNGCSTTSMPSSR